jgi:alkylation response protein AidB-like acyl-CoA dehydrogenase
MGATDYTVDLRDQHFVLFEQLKVQDLDDPKYEDYGQDLYEMVLGEATKFATETIAPLNGSGDQEGCKWVDGVVTTPKGYKEAYALYCEAGWPGVGIPVEADGQGLPAPVALAVNEIFTGASVAFSMYPGLTGSAGGLLLDMGTDWVKEHVVPHLVMGDWSGTMCLTEPQAGSAVGDASTKALLQEDGTYLLEGTKIFVSNGEHDLTPNIIHIMLARAPDAPAGIKGLSLFWVPKMLINEDGSLGEANDVFCSGIEHKMGINGSATSTLSLGDKGACKGWIIGREGEGIKRMFHMMNEARLGVGVQGYGVASAAYHCALDYSRERIQGTRFQDFKNVNAKRVAIIEHPNVRRMLLYCRAQVDGMRALGLTLANAAEIAVLKKGSFEGEKADDLLSVLTPVLKSWCTDQGFQVASQALQVFGGYGYCREYPAEQHVRDARIFPIYEGTNGIQAMDLVGRKMAMKGGQSFMGLMNWINDNIKQIATIPDLAAELKEIEKARDRLANASMHIMQVAMVGQMELPILHAPELLNLVGDVVIATLVGIQAVIAHPKLKELADGAGINLKNLRARNKWMEDNTEAAFYQRKLDNLDYFAHQFLPRTATFLDMITSPDRSPLDCIL